MSLMKEYFSAIRYMFAEPAQIALVVGSISAILASPLSRIPVSIRQIIALWLPLALLLLAITVPAYGHGVRDAFGRGIYIAFGIAFSIYTVRSLEGRRRALGLTFLILLTTILILLPFDYY